MERLEEIISHPVSQLLSSLALPHYQRVGCKYSAFANIHSCDIYAVNIFEMINAVDFI